jgi:formylglycine-generating enzyme required for sulfatase activity
MPDLILQKERKQARYFTERLAEDVGLDMILVPGGQFMMGSPEDEPEREENEGPQHLVSVPAFFMGRYPVTQAQWRVVAEFPQVNQELEPDPAQFKGGNRPVEQVSWYDAVEFCNRLARHTSRPYRLPSEAEWEYACRAGTTTPFYFGDTLTTEVTNYDGNYTYGDVSKGEYRQETTPVDDFGIANAFGLCDMHGNVDEWCQDHYHGNYQGAPTEGSAWEDEDADENVARILRGGSWDDDPRGCRSAYRFNGIPRVSYYFGIGFRIVCSAPRALR